MATLLASFPNSRIKPRPATTASTTPVVTAVDGVATLIVAADPNRANLTLRNTSSSDVYYGYVNTIDGTVANGGFLLKGLDSVDIQDPGDVYVYNNSGADVEIAVDQGVG